MDSRTTEPDDYYIPEPVEAEQDTEEESLHRAAEESPEDRSPMLVNCDSQRA